MEKYAVVQEEQQKPGEKVASRVTHCPRCKEELVENNQFLLWCPNCGTEPFEKKNK